MEPARHPQAPPESLCFLSFPCAPPSEGLQEASRPQQEPSPLCLPQCVGPRPVPLAAIGRRSSRAVLGRPPHATGFYLMPGSLRSVPKGCIDGSEGLPAPAWNGGGGDGVPLYELIFFLDHRNERSAMAGTMTGVWRPAGCRRRGPQSFVAVC